MSTKPDVRPAGPNHPNPAKREKKLHPPVEVRELISDAAQALFNERGGKRLVQSLDSIEGALFMHHQDIERGKRNEDPERFRWRVTPGVAIRLRKELDELIARLEELMKQCEADAEKRVNEMYPRSEFFYPGDEIAADRNTEQGQEAAPTAPIPTAG
jgi:hypothetical protein